MQKLEAFVDTTGKKFGEHEKRIVDLEKLVANLQHHGDLMEKAIKAREEEIASLRSEILGISGKMTELEEQNLGLREENALAFTKVFKKFESSATPEGIHGFLDRYEKRLTLDIFTGLQKEMASLKEGADNRITVLESLMREIGGDKMKGLVQDVANLQHDTVTLWKENSRMVPLPHFRAFSALYL